MPQITNRQTHIQGITVATCSGETAGGRHHVAIGSNYAATCVFLEHRYTGVATSSGKTQPPTSLYIHTHTHIR